ncbi:MAG: AAA family ATPase, partial [Metallosphaera sp.]
EGMRECVNKVSTQCAQNDRDCRDAKMRDCMKGATIKVENRHFDEALKKVKPSLTQEMIQFYQSWIDKARQQLPRQTVKPSTFT